MALTNLASGTTEELKLWAKDLWKVARRKSFAEKFTGDGANSIIQRVREFKSDNKGAKAVITLVPDLTGDGVTGDYQLTGNEQNITAYDQVIQVDQLRAGMKSAGRMPERKALVDFRKTARDQLGYWLANRRDQMTFLALSGIPFTKNNDYTNRATLATGLNLGDLAFAADVAAPTNKRVVALIGTNTISDESGFATTGTLRKLTYADVVNLKAIAKERGIRGVTTEGGDEVYHLFLTPTGMAQLKLDPDFIANVRHAGVRGPANDLFVGTNDVLVDGVVIHEFNYVVSTRGAASGSRMGSTGTQHGQRALLCGAQALGVADIGDPYWDEADVNDYNNQFGIGIGKIFGMRKTKFKGSWDDPTNVQDFGVLCVDTAI